MKKFVSSLLLLLFVSTMSVSALTIKLGSLFPEGSSWDKTLKKMAREWKEISGGRVTLKIYPGGIAGNEGDMVRKMRIGQLDAAVLTSMGMTEVVPETLIFSLPFLVQTEDELDFMMDEMIPGFNEEFRDKGFEVMVWSKSGWVNFFSNSEINNPDELRKTRIAVSPDSPEMMEAFKALNFKVIPLGLNDTLMGLQSGMIDSFYSIPMAAAAYQWFAFAKNMNPKPMAPVLGGIILSERAWRKIPARYHEDFKAAMENVAHEFYVETEKLNQEGLRVMKEHDLKVLTPSEADNQAWHDMFKDGYPMIVGPGKAISNETYVDIRDKIDAYRKRQ
ncbi:MAG: TRAP transporter substrate-binding protein DctP [Spirochaetales bacterium]|nr:TRAP transporter substrate-binding protein DctP [Spirochaetales bacterium]